MVMTKISLEDSQKKIWFFEKTFLLANSSMKVVLGILFLALSNANLQYNIEKLTWTSYTVIEILSTINRIKFINKNNFAKLALNKNSKTIVVCMITLDIEILIHPFREAQIATL